MRDPDTVRFSHFKAVSAEPIKITFLHITSEVGMWIKAVQEKNKNAFHERSQMQGAVVILGAGKRV